MNRAPFLKGIFDKILHQTDTVTQSSSMTSLVLHIKIIESRDRNLSLAKL